MNRPAIVITTLLVGSYSLSSAAFRWTLGGDYQAAVTPTTPSDQIVQAVKGKRVLSSTPDLGNPNDTRDYRAINITYFANASWLVADIPPRSTLEQQTTVLMRQQGSRYVLSIGPGTDFPRDELDAAQAPPELIAYLEGRGMVSTGGVQ
jgi:hypothetical protein